MRARRSRTTPTAAAVASLAQSVAEFQRLGSAVAPLQRTFDAIRMALAPLLRDLDDRARALDRRLAEAVAQYPTIDPAQVRAILFPPGEGSPLAVLHAVHELPALTELDRLYQQAIAIETDATAVDAIRVRLVAVAERRARITPLAAKVGGPVDRFERSRWMSDRIVALADYLIPIVPGRRARYRGHSHRHLRPSDPRPYKTAVCSLTADLVTSAYAPYFLWQARPLTAPDVKARICERQRRRRVR